MPAIVDAARLGKHYCRGKARAKDRGAQSIACPQIDFDDDAVHHRLADRCRGRRLESLDFSSNLCQVMFDLAKAVHTSSCTSPPHVIVAKMLGQIMPRLARAHTHTYMHAYMHTHTHTHTHTHCVVQVLRRGVVDEHILQVDSDDASKRILYVGCQRIEGVVHEEEGH